MAGEESLADAFAQVTAVLRSEFPVEELLDRLVGGCVAGLEADAAGVVVADARGDLQPSATTGGPVRTLGLLQLRWQEGPAPDSHRSGQAVVVRAAGVHRRWPRFGPECARAGFGGVLAVPMRGPEQVSGVVTLFQRSSAGFAPATVRSAQALADLGATGLLQREQSRLVEQLRHALSSRVVIEQAKGVLAERFSRDTEQAFEVLRGFARSGNHRLTEVARAVVDGIPARPAAEREPVRAAVGQ